jgi:hypothetical protein
MAYRRASGEISDAHFVLPHLVRLQPETGSGHVFTERTILHKRKKDLKSAGVIENLTTEVAENKFAAKDERF